MKKYLLIALLLCSLQTLAQKIEVSEEDYGNFEVEMADEMRKSGKIYVVVLVLSVVMGGILTYVIVIDRKLKKLEREIK
ncbi:CcmD family protein [Fulvivirgaceae bacterium BMA12]|uniref:CcmD family protein n=1 Tax=Agaribacillus aureus TaxID=3051825 RepID=A0ABT8LD47_9BACT|nr:CcmD family protein [Fulvivirgaceae bacterium BMA12]